MGTYYICEAEDRMGRCLVMTDSWSDDVKSVIDRESISVLRLSHSVGWKGNDISFLEQLPHLRGVEIYGWDIKDITPLRFVEGLESLGLQCNFDRAPNFETFEGLRVCKLIWRPKANGIFECTGLNLLNVVNYPAEDLSAFVNLVNLRRLQITSKKLNSLEGIESIRALKILDLAECYRLESLSGIRRCEHLHTFEMHNCKRINEIGDLGKLEHLGSVVLTDCGTIESLKPLANCRLLERLIFSGDTRIDDGNLGCLLKIPTLREVWFANRRHYSHKREELADLLSEA